MDYTHKYVNCPMRSDDGYCTAAVGLRCEQVWYKSCTRLQNAFKLGRNYEIKRIGTDVIQMGAQIPEAQLEELRILLRGAQAQLRVAEATTTGYWEYGSWEDGRWVKGNTRCRCSNCLRDFAVDNANIWKCCPHCMSINSVERSE